MAGTVEVLPALSPIDARRRALTLRHSGAHRQRQRPRAHPRRPWRRAPRRVPSIGASNPSVPPARARLWVALPPAGRPCRGARDGGQSRPAGRLQGCAPRARACGQAHRAEALARAARRGVAYRCSAGYHMASWRGGRGAGDDGAGGAEPSSKNFPCGGRRSEAPSSGAPAGPRPTRRRRGGR